MAPQGWIQTSWSVSAKADRRPWRLYNFEFVPARLRHDAQPWAQHHVARSLGTREEGPMRRAVGAVLLVGHLTVGVAAAQTVSATMGAVDGRVTDHTNAVLPGVTVTIGGPAMMGTRVVTTNQEGAYRLAAVPPGTYTVTFELDGFAPVTRTDIRIDLGFTATLTVQMAIGAVSENLTVTGASPVLD